ncbi:hypothetical protein IFM46972_02693 [Aspergillus udagawae]|uniref:Uncharacterized protein n=1 Tax=Aspergillus udagawae TaxID=91492 RepID=A0A8H3N9I5_9EURO|nr:hypothetical protein IFM46972_02693 [Aspergillus udagawae]
MSSSTKPTDSTDSPQDEYHPANWTALQEDDNGLSYMGTQLVNANVCNKGKQPPAAQDTRAPQFNTLDQRALNFHHEEVPIVYAKLDKNGKPYYILSSLGTSLLLWCWLCQPQSYGSTPADSPKKRYYREGDTVYYCLQWNTMTVALADSFAGPLLGGSVAVGVTDWSLSPNNRDSANFGIFDVNARILNFLYGR